MPNKKQLTPRLNRLEPNLVIDGAMEIWPEGTSRSIANGTSGYGSVLFKTFNESSGITITNSQQSSVPSGTNLQFSNQISKTAAGTLSSTTAIVTRHDIEGYNVDRIYNNDFSVIFWVKSSVVSNRSVSLTNASGSHCIVKQYNISTANTWQLKVVTFPALSVCPGTINRTNGSGLGIRFGVVIGSSQQTSTLGSWQAGSFASGVGEDTTWLTGTNHDFSIAGVMVLPGDWTSLQTNTSAYTFLRAGRNFQQELAMSQRYFEKSNPLDIAPGAVGSQNRFYTGILNGGGGGAHGPVVFAVRKRATPTIGYWDGTIINQAFWRRASADTSTAMTPNGLNEYGFDPVNNTAGAAWAVSQLAFNWSADARF